MSLSMGQNPGYINNIESGKSMPSLCGIFYICEYLGMTPKDFFDIATKEGALRVKSLQLEGKKKVAVKDFLLGYEIVCGMKF